jgi:nitrite reductase/ring-hydroxylating ferredoxin subunit
MTRRDWLQVTALFGGAPCACLAGASRDCCTLPEAPLEAVQYDKDTVVIDLSRVPELKRAGGALKVVDSGRKIQILIASVARDRFVALDQKCTHGGGALTYVHRHQHLYCTCWGHSKFALDGSVLRWPNSQKPRPLRAYTVERRDGHLYVHTENAV